MTTWVDSHCHLHMSDTGAAELLDRAAAVGVEWVVCPGTDAAGSEESARLASAFPGRVLSTSGLHPHEASRWPDEGDRIAELAATASAVGECGLDFYRNLSPRDAQRTAFREQLGDEGAVCVDPPGSCDDGERNDDETDVDCGGGTCSACGVFWIDQLGTGLSEQKIPRDTDVG